MGTSEYRSGLVGMRMIRKLRGINQQKAAIDLNISREALSHYETGKRSPDIDMLLRLSDYFDVSVDFLITGKEFEARRKK